MPFGSNPNFPPNFPIRYLGALARASLNLGFYGANGLDFNGDGWYLLQELMFRIPGSDFFLGGRFDYLTMDIRFADGDPPFYALPYIDLRGIPALRYQGEDVLVTEIEARWNLHGRWALVGFTEVGRAEDSLDDLFGSGSGDLRHTYGTG